MTEVPDREARDGDKAVYERCLLGESCSAFRKGIGHAHLKQIERLVPVGVVEGAPQ